MGIKQEAFAAKMGDDCTQKKVTLLGDKDCIDDDLMEQIAQVLKVPAEAIRNFSEDVAINIIGNTVTNHDNVSILIA
ncbi:hypothetical protein [Deminuibacter soli]|uniref:hypothetical protein n=1 Tax=Deminuibacter soli TaxID=2291815 RepID=UPI001FE972A3|nr:hypothetical protein [Deminuibacter soli]